ncbi:DUF1223 domain-containing protein [Pseudomonas paeninsulae]|uniref:DUF1223 domain-containing protein n=1 Tax=Pseudomonas paeninsulae TaxID=3110772 RepID=UPI002D7883B2|nr:DUF1223 domain-containing protein [Pseudomonas sp. IT1137]
MKLLFPALWVALCVLCAPVHAEPRLRLTSSATATPVLELFTSQGCSSCPPAERWLSALTEHPALWNEVIPLAFHVDYWDRLGWVDPFANPGYSARQRAYARSGGSQGVYTPEFILAGHEWRGWFQRQPLPLVQMPTVGRLVLEIDGDNLKLTFTPANSAPARLTAHVARLGFGLSTAVGRGENAGRTLTHDFVVLTLQQLGASETHHWQTRLAADSRGERQALVAWLTASGQPTPYQAVGGWLLTTSTEGQ